MFIQRDERLWAAVITQAIADATMSVSEPKPGASRVRLLELAAKRQAKQEARDWLLNDEDDFEAVCASADMCPSSVRAYARKMLGGT